MAIHCEFLGAGLGFMLAMVLFAGVRERLESCEVPKFLQGLPITLIAASLVSVSFLGFTGIVEGMFQLTRRKKEWIIRMGNK